MPLNLGFKAYDLSTGPAEGTTPAGTGVPAGSTPAITIGDALTEQLIALFLKDANQHRKTKVRENHLMQVALARATDMAKKAYFDHTDPLGFGVNHYIRNSGYKLPGFYATANNANNCESIAAGYADAAACWAGWLGSPHHKAHVLGEISFYADQVDYGVAHYQLAGSPYVHYWVFVSART